MKKITSLLCVSLILTNSFIHAQQEEQGDLFKSPFQFTFLFPPLSTNGLRNSKTVNKVSLNLLVGNSGATDGVELGGLINTDNYYVNGFQGAGFGNFVAGPVSGAQLAGFFNINAGATSSFQGAGFINVVSGEFQGAQLAGFVNVSGSSTRGAQLAGFVSVNGAGLNNAQISGFCNVGRDVSGAQVAGFVNVADKVRGVQVAGFINVCDSLDGVPIGFVNVVRQNGYRQFEFNLSETQYANFSYRMGVRKLYNIYTFGKPMGPGSRWLFGFGLGSELNVNEKMHMNIEALINQELWIADSQVGSLLHIDRLNLLNQLRILFGFSPSDQVSLFVGPTLNIAVSETSPDIGYLPYHEIGPNWAFYNHTKGNAGRTNIKIWIGITGGVRL